MVATPLAASESYNGTSKLFGFEVARGFINFAKV